MKTIDGAAVPGNRLQRVVREDLFSLNQRGDVTRDGQQFILAASSDTQRSLPLTVIHDWRVGLDLPDAK